MGYSGLNQEQIVAMPCNLVRILQIGVRRDVSNFRALVVQEEEPCQHVVRMTNAAVIPSGWSCPRTRIFDLIFTSSVEKSQSATGPLPSAFSMLRLRPIVTG
eukprot:5482141-Pleurochrysis_carterae.AAC.1